MDEGDFKVRNGSLEDSKDILNGGGSLDWRIQYGCRTQTPGKKLQRPYKTCYK